MAILPLVLRGVAFEAGGRRLVDGVDLEVHPGDRIIVLGANGAGKSLLLRLCHGLIRPSAGTIAWTGPEPLKARAAQAMVFQRPVMLRRSVRANVDYALALRGIAAPARARRVAQVLERTGLAGLERRPARVLSGGEQQLLALARAWALEPEILFLDEPTASLDPAATGAVERIVLEIHAGGTAIVMTTHDLGQARRMAREVVFIHGGRLAERTPAGAFFAEPRTAAAAAFIAGRLDS